MLFYFAWPLKTLYTTSQNSSIGWYTGGSGYLSEAHLFISSGLSHSHIHSDTNATLGAVQVSVSCWRTLQQHVSGLGIEPLILWSFCRSTTWVAPTIKCCLNFCFLKGLVVSDLPDCCISVNLNMWQTYSLCCRLSGELGWEPPAFLVNSWMPKQVSLKRYWKLVKQSSTGWFWSTLAQ